MSVAVVQQRMFVDGEFVDARSGETMEVLNPATGEVIAEVPKAGEEDVDRAVAAAEAAWETWRDKTPKDRMELLLKLADVIDENAEELARLESLNVGKPWWVAVDVLLAGLGHLGDHLAGGGVQDIHRLARERVDELAADEHLLLAHRNAHRSPSATRRRRRD